MDMPKILSPVTSFRGAVEVVSAGADEIYCGVRIPGALEILNRPDICYVQTYDELARIADHARSRGVETIVTLGLPFIAEFVAPEMREHTSACVRAGVDALIVGDIGLIRMIRDDMGLDIPIYASTLLGAMNYEAADFIRKLGVQRVVLERHVGIEEIGEVVRRNRDVEIEVFMHGGGCSNINANCRLEYAQASADATRKARRGVRGDTNPCRWSFDVYELGNGERRITTTPVPILDAYTFCSLCALPELIKTGVAGLKIVGRCRPIAYQVKATQMYRNLLDLMARGQRRAFNRVQRKRFFGMVESFQEEPTQPAFRNRDGSFRTLRDMWCSEERCYYSPFFHAPYKASESGHSG
jgi:putative protease